MLYQPGDPGNALFIVNRGALEIHGDKGAGKGRNTVLARGEVIGDVEAFSGLPRLHLVKAREAASVQCFPRANFQELVRQVPSFFRYLCEQMAFRVAQAADLARNQDHSAPLSGRISHFDLTTVHQTLAHSGQTGELTIRDDQSETIGAFYFESGRPSAGQFQHLTGEEAFWQLFLTETLSGTFSFSVGERSLTQCIDSERITRSADDMLIAALQYRDEYDELKKGAPAAAVKLRAVGSGDLQWNGKAPPELKAVAGRIWEILLRKPATIRELYRQCAVCELKVHQVIEELLAANQVKPFDPAVELKAEPAGCA